MAGVYAEQWLKDVLLRTALVRRKVGRVLGEINFQLLLVESQLNTCNHFKVAIHFGYKWLTYAEALAHYLNYRAVHDQDLEHRLEFVLSQLEKISSQLYTLVTPGLVAGTASDPKVNAGELSRHL